MRGRTRVNGHVTAHLGNMDTPHGLTAPDLQMILELKLYIPCNLGAATMARRTRELVAATFLFTVLTSTIVAQAARPVSDAEAGDISLGDVRTTDGLSGQDPFAGQGITISQKWERRSGFVVSSV
jgi:hypothetical protein